MIYFIAPKAPTGYGIGARIYANHLSYEDNWIDLANMPEDWKSLELDEEGRVVIFWHLGHLSEYLPKKSKNPIALTTFEVDDFTDDQKRDAQNFRAIGTCSKWGKDLIEEKLQVPSFVLPHYSIVNAPSFGYHSTRSEHVEEYEDAIQSIIEYCGSRKIDRPYHDFLSVGKYEARKSQAEILEAFTLANRSCLLMGLWHNPFLPGGMDFSDLHYLGYREFPKRFNAFRIFYHDKSGTFVLLPKVRLENDVLQRIYNFADTFISASKAEGFNIPLYDAVCMQKSIITTVNTGQEFINKDGWEGEITSGPLVPAVDGKWFHGTGRWHSVDVKDIADQINAAIDGKTNLYTISDKSNAEYKNLLSAVQAFD